MAALKERELWLPVMAGFVLWAILTGFTCLFLSAHYPTDIVADYALGAFWLACSVFLIDCWIQVK